MIPRRFPIRRVIASLVVLGLVAWFSWVLYSGSRLKIGRETTFVTGPMTPDGRIDYAAAIHQRLSAGVKPADNAAILLDQAFGPGAISPDLRLRYFDWMSTDPLPESGDYVVSEGEFTQRKTQAPNASVDLKEMISQQFQRSAERPWIREDYPLVAEWLDANAKPLELIVQASLRSQYYSPLVTREGVNDGETTSPNLRETARLLVRRARFRIANNDVPGAWDDLLACHRLGYLASQRAPSMMCYQIAYAVNSMAVKGDETLVAHGMSAGQARQCLNDHAKLPPFGSLVELIDQQQRMGALDAVLRLDTPVLQWFINSLLRRTNHVYDNFVDALKREGYEERIKAMNKIGTDLKKSAGQFPNQLISPGEAVIDVLLSLNVPVIAQTITSETRIQLRHDLVQIGFALAAHDAERNAYPQTLDELVPEYLSAVPLDKYTGKPLNYVPRKNGFLVYSVGANGRDEDGQMTGQTGSDDISFEIPTRFDE